MKAFLLFADAARTHPDGTFSVLRGGIDRLETPPSQPAVLKGTLLLRTRAALSEVGKHRFVIRFQNADGQRIAPDLEGEFEIPEGGGSGQLALDVHFTLPEFGRFQFSVSIDGVEHDTWTISSEKKTEAAK